MTHTIQCPECGIVLNVPDSAAGRKLKCPKCATKFSAPRLGPADSALGGPGPASTIFPTRKGPHAGSSGDFDAIPGAGSSGSIELPALKPAKGIKIGDLDLPSLPVGDTFELPLLADDRPGKPHVKVPASAPDDALALFQDEPKSARKPKGAEARAKARRCPSCGGVVGVGMSLCNTCGLDLDTGQRIAPADVFDEDEIPAAPRAEMPPMGVLFVGSVVALKNLLLVFASLVAYTKGQGSGMLCLMIVWFFGIYASIQFLRLKAIRPLFLALGLGVAIGSVYLIALPIWEVNVVDDVAVNQSFEAPPGDSEDAPAVRNIAEQLDMRRITWGIALLLSYATLSLYLNTPAVKREFARR